MLGVFNVISSFLNKQSHFSKHKSGIKQKLTQRLTPFSGTVFYALLHGLIHFARSVSFENKLNIETSDWLLENLHHSETMFLGLIACSW